MADKRYSDADFRRAVANTAAKTVERSKQSGRPVSYENARNDAAKRAERVRRKQDSK